MNHSRGAFQQRMARHIPLIVVSLCFLTTRAIYVWGFGVRFDETGIEWACQTLDTDLLRHDLLRNVFYLHHQVPLWNVLIGVVFKLFPVHHAEAFAAIHCLLGFAFSVSILSIFHSLGVGPASRTLATVLFSSSPPVIAYEWWINYHQLGAPFLAMSLAALGVFLRSGKQRWGHAAFAFLVVETLARSVFGLTWIVGIVVILFAARPLPRRAVLRVAAIPLFLVFLSTIKTPIQTGRSFGHALVAPNLALKVLRQLPSFERDKLFAEGKLSRLTSHDPFIIPSTLPEFDVRLPKTGVPGLDQERKGNGEPNANCLKHVYLGDVYMKDAKWLIVHYPTKYLASVGYGLSTGFMKASTDVDVVPGTVAYKATSTVQDAFRRALVLDESTGRLWALTIALPMSLLYGVVWLLGPKARLPSSRTRAPMIAIMVLTIFNVLATAFLSWGDYSRYRFDVDAVFLVLFVLLVQALGARVAALAARARYALTR